LNVTGGTGPYDYLWDDGSTTSYLTNLVAGTYEVTVSDYFSDYVIRTFCVVSSAPSTPTQTPTPTITPTIGLSPTNTPTSTLTPTPSSTPPLILCATFSLKDSTGVVRYEQYQFNFNTIIAGSYSWTANTSQNYLTNTGFLLLSFGGGPSGVWSISQVLNTNNIEWFFTVQTSVASNIVPTNGWYINGNTTYIDSFNRTNVIQSVQVESGTCKVITLKATLTSVNATCPQYSDGSITVVANGGTLPYTYSLDSFNYTPNNTFLNLSSGFYTVYVKDSDTTPQIFSESIIVDTVYSQPQPTNLTFRRVNFVPGSNNNQPTIIDEFSQYELNLNGLSNGVSLSTFDLNLQIQNITKQPGVTNANGTTVMVSVNNTQIFFTSITQSTLWTQTNSQPRGNTACPTDLTITKQIITTIPVVQLLGQNLNRTDNVVVEITNKAQIVTPSPQRTCPTELTNTIILSSKYVTFGPTQICFPLVGNPSISENAFRTAAQSISPTYTGNWTVQVAGIATCVEILSVKTSGMDDSTSLRFDCNNQVGSVPNPFTSSSVSTNQTSIVSPPNAPSCGDSIIWVNPETFTINYFVNSPCTQCSGNYELSLSVNNTGVLVSSTIPMIPGNGLVTFDNIVINSNSIVTIKIDCII
jgi:hypothetical protein